MKGEATNLCYTNLYHSHNVVVSKSIASKKKKGHQLILWRMWRSRAQVYAPAKKDLK